MGDRLISLRLKYICEDDDLKSDDVRQAVVTDDVIRSYSMRYTMSGHAVLLACTELNDLRRCGSLDIHELLEAVSRVLLFSGVLLGVFWWLKGIIMRFLFFGYPRIMYEIFMVFPNKTLELLCAACEEREELPQY